MIKIFINKEQNNLNWQLKPKQEFTVKIAEWKENYKLQNCKN